MCEVLEVPTAQAGGGRCGMGWMVLPLRDPLGKTGNGWQDVRQGKARCDGAGASGDYRPPVVPPLAS